MRTALLQIERAQDLLLDLRCPLAVISSHPRVHCCMWSQSDANARGGSQGEAAYVEQSVCLCTSVVAE